MAKAVQLPHKWYGWRFVSSSSENNVFQDKSLPVSVRGTFDPDRIVCVGHVFRGDGVDHPESEFAQGNIIVYRSLYDAANRHMGGAVLARVVYGGLFRLNGANQRFEVAAKQITYLGFADVTEELVRWGRKCAFDVFDLWLDQPDKRKDEISGFLCGDPSSLRIIGGLASAAMRKNRNERRTFMMFPDFTDQEEHKRFIIRNATISAWCMARTPEQLEDDYGSDFYMKNGREVIRLHEAVDAARRAYTGAYPKYLAGDGSKWWSNDSQKRWDMAGRMQSDFLDAFLTEAKDDLISRTKGACCVFRDKGKEEICEDRG